MWTIVGILFVIFTTWLGILLNLALSNIVLDEVFDVSLKEVFQNWFGKK